MINLNDLDKEKKILWSFWGDSFEGAGSKGHRYYHSLRVAQNTLLIAEKAKLEITKNLIVATLFHDIGKAERVDSNGFLDGSREADEKMGDHNSQELVKKMIDKYLSDIYNEGDKKEVVEFICSKDNIYSKLISDADNLDEVGLINVWKIFTYSGYKKVSIKDTVDYFFNNDLPRLTQKIEDYFFLQESKTIANERINSMTKFFKDFKKIASLS